VEWCLAYTLSMTYQVSEADLKITDQAFEEIKNYNPTGADDFRLGLVSALLLALSREYEQLRVREIHWT
jgi:hypothetical protein